MTTTRIAIIGAGHSGICMGAHQDGDQFDILEAGITVLIELTWSKQRILEVYLNIAEFGRGTYGVQAASRRFFRKDAAKLGRSESALLAAVLPAPTRFRVDAPSNYVRRRQAWILRQMAALGGTAYVSGLD